VSARPQVKQASAASWFWAWQEGQNMAGKRRLQCAPRAGSTGAPPARQIAGLRALRYPGPGMSEASAHETLGPAR
jgi:hypothetical protein